MGCDGGSIPRRDEMVKLKKKAAKADRDMELVARWRHCALSGEELKEPIVACELGRLYNKEAVLMALLDRASLPEVARHLRSLKDVTVLQLSVNPGYRPVAQGDGYHDTQAAQYACPVTGLEMTGRYRFVFLRGCGCVLSEKALKEVPSETCHKCGRPFSSEQVVPLNAGEEEEKKLMEAMKQRRSEAKLSKRKRKAAVLAAEEAVPVSSDRATSSSSSNSNGSSGSEKDSPPPGKKVKLPPSSLSESPQPQKTDRETCRETGKLVGKVRKMVQGERDRSVSKDSSVPRPNSHTAVSGGRKSDSQTAISERAQDRKVYKSLFSSNSSQRPREKTSNWVTYFPYH